jgi:GxxExxY protein
MNANERELILKDEVYQIVGAGIEEAQILNYLKATNLPLGLIVNFGAPQLEWKRYVNTKRTR